MRIIHFLVFLITTSTALASDQPDTTVVDESGTRAKLESLDSGDRATKLQLASAVHESSFRAEGMKTDATSLSVDTMRTQAALLRDQGETLIKQQKQFVDAANQYAQELELAPAHFEEVAQRFEQLSQSRSGSPLAEAYQNNARLFQSLATKCADKAKEVRQAAQLVSENILLMDDSTRYFDHTQEALAFVPKIFDPQDQFNMRPAMAAYVKSFDQFQQAIRAEDAKLNGGTAGQQPEARTTFNSKPSASSMVVGTAVIAHASQHVQPATPAEMPNRVPDVQSRPIPAQFTTFRLGQSPREQATDEITAVRQTPSQPPATNDTALSLQCPDGHSILHVYASPFPKTEIGSLFDVVRNGSRVGRAQVTSLRWSFGGLNYWQLSLVEGTALADCDFRPIATNPITSPIFEARRP